MDGHFGQYPCMAWQRIRTKMTAWGKHYNSESFCGWYVREGGFAPELAFPSCSTHWAAELRGAICQFFRIGSRMAAALVDASDSIVRGVAYASQHGLSKHGGNALLVTQCIGFFAGYFQACIGLVRACSR